MNYELLLEAVQARLIAEVPTLKYVDEDWDQLNEDLPPVQFPCALISCGDADFSQLLQGKLLGLEQVRVRVAAIRLTNSSGRAPMVQRNQAYAIYGLISQVQKALHNWLPNVPVYGHLCCTRVGKVRNSDGVKIFDLSFTIGQKIAEDVAVQTITAVV